MWVPGDVLVLIGLTIEPLRTINQSTGCVIGVHFMSQDNFIVQERERLLCINITDVGSFSVRSYTLVSGFGKLLKKANSSITHEKFQTSGTVWNSAISNKICLLQCSVLWR